ncbi:MAG: mismatch repair protein [Proteobacteria bacterium]|nr:mismatch repair protein [Pseudomonadota bacterium]
MTPVEEYTDRLAAREADVRLLEAARQRMGSVRLLLAAIVVGLAWASYGEGWLSALWMLAPVAVFIGAVTYHGILRRRHSRAIRAVQFYRQGLGRLQDRWAGTGNRGERFADIHHVYAADLDVFGEGSLFELLCAVRTRMGEETLARWLLAPAQVGEIRRRQGGVRELRERLDLRERIGMLGSERGPALQPEGLLAWAEAPAMLLEARLRVAASLLPAVLAAALVTGALTGIWSPVLLVLIIEALTLYRLRERLEEVLFPPESAFDFEGLKILEGLLLEIEREKFDSPPLRALAEAPRPGNGSASARIGQLATLVRLSEQRLNPIVRAVQVPVLYLLQVALAVERWRRAYGMSVRGWVEAAGRFEALSSLAQYSFEHPNDIFPDFLEGRAQLRAQGIGHPLIPRSQCVRNDVTLSDRPRFWLISGSNMSGKSTLLRAVGLNVVLAMAGGPVRAEAFELTPLQVGASIRINDSLREGSSRFYAEIIRLRQLKDLCGRDPPLLFLIDEMLQGTNSNDRRIGAEGILGALVEEGAIGLATTHDLALTELRGLGEGVLQNMHFEDHLENGRMHFDYRLRTGVVTKSNGLELMRAIGLRV